MTTLREAAQQALEAMDKATRFMSDSDYKKLNQAIEDLSAALAEPVQEPVAWIHTDSDKPRVKFLEWREDEPGYRGSWIKTPLYTAPPQRKPLAEWQINDLMADIDPEDVCSWSFRQGVYAAEKHHGIRS